MLSRVRLRFFSSLTRLPSCVTPRAAAAAVGGGGGGGPCSGSLQQQRGYSAPPPGVRVLYDGLCPICVTEIRFLQYLQKKQPGKVDFIDIAVPGYDASKYKDVTFEKAMEEMHVIDENNVVHRGVPAFAVMYDAVGLGWLGRFMMWSPVRPLMDKAYAIFAKNRLKWTGRGEECSTGRCERK